MKTLVLLTLFGVTFSARLDSHYLTPGAGGGFGGGGGYSFGGGFGGGYSGGGGAHIPIIRYENHPNTGDGRYSYSYETGNGIQAQEEGQGRGGEQGTAAHGSYSYTGPDGQRYSISYTADENGFRPVGAHLPTPPPIPDAILRSLEQNRADGGSYDDGQYRPGAGGGGGFGGGTYVPPRSGYNY